MTTERLRRQGASIRPVGRPEALVAPSPLGLRSANYASNRRYLPSKHVVAGESLAHGAPILRGIVFTAAPVGTWPGAQGVTVEARHLQAELVRRERPNRQCEICARRPAQITVSTWHNGPNGRSPSQSRFFCAAHETEAAALLAMLQPDGPEAAAV